MKLLFVAGDPSGDLHAGNMAREILRREPAADLIGFGGPKMQRSGVELRYDMTGLAVVGFAEVLGSIGAIRRAMKAAKRTIASEKPDAVILVDYPGFNLPLAEYIHKLGIPVVYYIAPQVWAWHRSRVKKIARTVSKLLVVFEFEVEFFAEHGIRAVFVGHPLLDTIEHFQPKEKAENIQIGILPGSRKVEVDRLLPIMLNAASILDKEVDDAFFVVSIADSLPENYAVGMIERAGLEVEVAGSAARDIMTSSRAVMVASGTATLESCIFNVPMVVLYKVSLLSYLLARRVLTLDRVSLANLIGGGNVVPELMQNDASPRRVADEIKRLLDPVEARAQIEFLATVRKKLGGPGASARAAEEVIDLVRHT